MRIAVLTPSSNAYSETFIRNHKLLSGDVFFFFDGDIPKRVEGIAHGSSFYLWVFRFYFKFKGLLINRLFAYDEFLLKRNLKRLKIDVGLAEYGPTGAMSYEVFKSLEIPLLVHFHGYDASVHIVLKKFARLYSRMFEYAYAIIVVSIDMQNKVLEMGADPRKVILNPYGPQILFTKRSNLPKAKPIFLSVGRFTEKKAPLITIKAFAKVILERPDVRLWMIGNGPLLEEAKNLVQNLNLEKRVKFLGVKSSEEVANYMRSSYAFLLHSVTASNGDMEGTPVSILEAMAVGLPVVSTRHGGIKELVLHGVTGFLVEENDVQGMSEFMIRLVNEPKKQKQFGMNSKLRIRDFYSLDRHIEVIDQLILAACSSKN